ncbi:MAG: hypothetical protein SFU27_04110 [Thermonemataceae bacterium]|nr:hypothetical protein [Thermonemataceae bacterium]
MENRHNALQQPAEVLLQEIELENQIRELLNDTQIYFDYNLVPDKLDAKIPLIKLDLITINREHNQKFLLHSTKGYNKISILEDMMVYINDFKKKQETYELEWIDAKHNEKVQTSWFRGNDIFDILQKFYYDKKQSRFKILKITLMPET